MLSFTTVFARPVFALAAASATVLLAAPVLAAPTETARTELVWLDAADLNADASATTIHRRLSTAARKVCAPMGDTREEQMVARQCYDQAMRSAEGQLLAKREQAKRRQQTLAAAR